MKKIVIFIVMFALCFNIKAQEQPIKKSNLKVLYIGQNPEKHDGYSFGGNVELWEEIKQDRAKIFHEFFQKYFEKVTLVYGEDYKESMSDDYDVTVFDALPPRLDGTEGKYLQLFPKGPDFITDDYDAATVFIAGPGGAITWNRKGKIDWLCNCLDSHAYNIVEDHPIFNAPYKVDLTKEGKKHNPGVYGYYSSKDLSRDEEAPMWRVQDVDKYDFYPPGIVANPGFGDSADAEFIASGPSIKSVNAVSLGRHGNFFQWGYRADPRHLTESGKLALINTIHYMAQFKGQKPFVKRVSNHRLVALDHIFKVTDKGYEGVLRSLQRRNDSYNAAQIRKIAGKSKPGDKFYSEVKFPDRTVNLKSVPKELIEEYVDDWNAYLEYYESNQGYLAPESPDKVGDYYGIVIDKDLQKMGIANNDIKLLDTCVNMLVTNNQPELAQKLLTKYTTESFTTAKQWKKWLKKNRDNLFFTETGGYKWMVNPYK
jgi:hypothetical protein